MRKNTIKEFIEKARSIHGEKYDYSKVYYVNAHVKVCIICPVHGEFWQKPNNHTNGQGCLCCHLESTRTRNFGVGILDKDLLIPKGNAEKTWRQMLRRGCSPKFKIDVPSYADVCVCDEWKTYSKFKEWYDKHYVPGWTLDKDILRKGNKQYGPETCCFVPPQINTLFTQRTRDRGLLPIGVSMRRGKIVASVNRFGKHIDLGVFKCEEDAFQAYKAAKESYIKEVADKWKDKIEPRVYEAMYNWKVEITD